MHGNNITSIENNETKRWLIIGAHQAGASDKKIARMCGVNQPSVRRIILNFQKTGSPSIPRKLSQKGLSTTFFSYELEK
jgi:transposase